MSALGVRGIAYQREISAVQRLGGTSPPYGVTHVTIQRGRLPTSGEVRGVVCSRSCQEAGMMALASPHGQEMTGLDTSVTLLSSCCACQVCGVDSGSEHRWHPQPSWRLLWA